MGEILAPDTGRSSLRSCKAAKSTWIFLPIAARMIKRQGPTLPSF